MSQLQTLTASLLFRPGTLACSLAAFRLSPKALTFLRAHDFSPRDAPESAPGARNESLEAPSPMLAEELCPLLTGDLKNEARAMLRYRLEA